MQAALDRLGKALEERVIQRSVNRVADQVKTKAVRDISREFNMTSAQVRERIVVSRASAKYGKLSAYVWAPMAKGRYRALHISDLKGTKDLRNSFGRVGGNVVRMARRDRKGRLTTKGGVQFSIIKGKTAVLKDAFIAPGKNSGKLIVFQRQNLADPRSKLEAKYVIDVPQMFNAQRIKRDLNDLVSTKLPDEVRRQLKLATARR